ncbi:MAG: hypothetical protein GY708_16825 [Actinomycetia bacterium]|nr:hypothetical protein [Actinomycetes bacterium]
MVLVDEVVADGDVGDWWAWFDRFRGFGVVGGALFDALVQLRFTKCVLWVQSWSRFLAAWVLQGPSAIEGLREHGEHCRIGRRELRPVDLSLEHSHPVAKSEDLCGTVITGHGKQTDTGEHESDQPRDQ